MTGDDHACWREREHRLALRDRARLSRFFRVSHWIKSVLAPAATLKASQPQAHGLMEQALHRAGFGVLLMESRTHGRSERDDHSSLPRFAEELDRAIDGLKTVARVDAMRIVALGHSAIRARIAEKLARPALNTGQLAL